MLPAHHPLIFGYYILAAPTVEQYYDRGIIHALPCRRNIAEIIRLRDTEFSQIQSQLRFRIQPRFFVPGRVMIMVLLKILLPCCCPKRLNESVGYADRMQLQFFSSDFVYSSSCLRSLKRYDTSESL